MTYPTGPGSALAAPHAPIRVLVVDDSATMRRMVCESLGKDPGLVVVAEASHPLEARDAIKALRPDVLTLDVEMPHMNGLEFLRRLMDRRPTPVVMLSSLTGAGSRAAVEALSIGAVDCVEKPVGGVGGLGDLAERVRTAAGANLVARATAPARDAASDAACAPLNGRIVCIGASTGGVDALEQVLTRIPAGGPPIVITQHMPEGFLRSFASRLDPMCAVSVSLAREGAALEPGRVYLAPGGAQHLQLSASWPPRCHLQTGEKVSGHRPSVDVLFRSALPHARRVVGVLLTGMGQDGAQGLRALRDGGARTVVQDKATSVVFGMPRVAIELGAAEKTLPIDRIGAEIVALCTADLKAERGLRA
jgi:two-component system chemotaxis response regulator CheB